MKCVNLKVLGVVLILISNLNVPAQTYPFQSIKLMEDMRLDNLISLMTLDEKIGCLSDILSVPRLGIKGRHFDEGLHSLALDGVACFN
jgi:beta-glucosidase